ncbi:Flp pilus assembly complex ATPase component TadA [Candidatus Micrarchaeota archaeon]|nr:Flp pilus assembly complex ATPase component TadA [Candidatus Micrarchaeota archaeon]
MCQLYLEGTCAVVDMSKCPFEFASPEFINFHLKDLSSQDVEIKTIRYKEQMVIELDEGRAAVLTQYADVIKQIEQLLLRTDIYGIKEDPAFDFRKKLLRRFYEEMLISPLSAERLITGYKEEPPEKQVFIAGHQKFKGLLVNILKVFSVTKMYDLVKKTGDFRAAFLSLTDLGLLDYVDLLIFNLPHDAKPLSEPDAHYKLAYGYEVQLYEVSGSDALIYAQTNPILEALSPYLKGLLKQHIEGQMKESFEAINYNIIMPLKSRDYRQFFLDKAVLDGEKITPREAQVMGREVAAWVVGLGGHVENLALDNENITDIYTANNKPIAIEHVKYGHCRTLLRYNAEMLARAFKNALLTLGDIKFDETSPVADVVVKRLSMRCHLQHPAATFGEYQGALRIMKEKPFTYAQYLFFKSFSPFYAGYDDVLVSLGCSEAVLGLKGVGKTSFTAAKITAIGTKKRIVALQDIEEIPILAYRNRNFDIDAGRVQSSDREEGGPGGTAGLDLIAMANASLRLGDAAIIINEVRSSVALKGVINILNTQPGVFLLYNLHAESLKNVQDRFELVWHIPADSMYATDRYTFLKKFRFGRSGRMYRVLGFEYQSDMEKREFVETFRFRGADAIDKCILECKFLRNPEASMNDLTKVDLGKLEKELDIAFVPPALARRSEETGIPPEQYILQAFFKGKMYHLIFKTSQELNDKYLLELDFVLRVNSGANKIISSLEKDSYVNFAEAWKQFEVMFKQALHEELARREQKKAEKAAAHKANAK